MSIHCHQVVGLRTVKILKNSPWGKKSPKLKGSRAKGKTYERTVVRHLKRAFLEPELIHYNEWLGFTDATGSHYCQPDIYVELPSYILLLEVKLTQTDSAAYQLAGLYRPLLEALYSKPVVMVQVCKNLRYPPKYEIHALREAKKPGQIYTYHFIGELLNV